MRYEPVTIPFRITQFEPDMVVALDRNFAAIEQALSRMQVYENTYGIPANVDILGGVSIREYIVNYGEKKVFQQDLAPTIGMGSDEAREFDMWLKYESGTPVWRQLRRVDGTLTWVVVANRSTHPAEYDIITTVGLDAAVITTGLLNAAVVQIGAASTFAAGYNPSEHDSTQTIIDGGLITTGTIQLKDGADVTKAGITATGDGDAQVRFWAGQTFDNRFIAPFRVTQGGEIFSTYGEIGGWTIDETNGLKLGTGSNTRGIHTGDYTFYAGNASPASAPFSVTKEGNMVANAGTLRGLNLAEPGAVAGLFLSNTHLGYYDGGNWKTFMQNNGNFYLGGATGDLVWDGSTLSITGNITVTGGVIDATYITAGVLDATSIAIQGYEAVTVSNATTHYGITKWDQLPVGVDTMQKVIDGCDLHTSLFQWDSGGITARNPLYQESVWWNFDYHGLRFTKNNGATYHHYLGHDLFVIGSDSIFYGDIAVSATMGGTTFISGGYIETGWINADRIDTGTLSANRIAAYSLGADKFDVTVIDGGKIVTGLLTASNIITGTLDASEVNVTNINADNINAGTLSADRIDVGSITITGLGGASTFEAYDTTHVDGVAAGTVRNNSATGADHAGTVHAPSGATEGADWNNNLDNIPGTIGAPSGTGLFLSSTYMGFYTGGEWKTFIKNDGKFAFAGDLNNYIGWDGITLEVAGELQAATGTFTGELSAVTGTFEDIKAGGTDDYVRLYADSNDNPFIRVYSGGKERVRISKESFRIFDSSEKERLYLSGGQLDYKSTTEKLRASLRSDGLYLYNDAGAYRGKVTGLDGGGHQYLDLLGSDRVYLKGGGTAALMLHQDDNVSIWGDTSVSGTFYASGGKNFCIPHPLKKGSLIHASVESPRYDLLYRGTCRLKKGQAEIDLDKESMMSPGTFESLTQNAAVMGLNNESDFTRLKTTKVVNGKFKILAEEKVEAIVSWIVMAERADKDIIACKYTDHLGKLIPEQSSKVIPEQPKKGG